MRSFIVSKLATYGLDLIELALRNRDIEVEQVCEVPKDLTNDDWLLVNLDYNNRLLLPISHPNVIYGGYIASYNADKLIERNPSHSVVCGYCESRIADILLSKPHGKVFPKEDELCEDYDYSMIKNGLYESSRGCFWKPKCTFCTNYENKHIIFDADKIIANLPNPEDRRMIRDHASSMHLPTSLKLSDLGYQIFGFIDPVFAAAAVKGGLKDAYLTVGMDVVRDPLVNPAKAKQIDFGALRELACTNNVFITCVVDDEESARRVRDVYREEGLFENCTCTMQEWISYYLDDPIPSLDWEYAVLNKGDSITPLGWAVFPDDVEVVILTTGERCLHESFRYNKVHISYDYKRKMGCAAHRQKLIDRCKRKYLVMIDDDFKGGNISGTIVELLALARRENATLVAPKVQPPGTTKFYAKHLLVVDVEQVRKLGVRINTSALLDDLVFGASIITKGGKVILSGGEDLNFNEGPWENIDSTSIIFTLASHDAFVEELCQKMRVTRDFIYPETEERAEYWWDWLHRTSAKMALKDIDNWEFTTKRRMP